MLSSTDQKSRPFTTTDQHAVFWAWDLSKRTQQDGYSKIAGSMMGAQVDLNPHQVDAALFALKSPLSLGVLLADEVGLGKTIEAGIVMAQRWAERKRRILLIVPATLRKQWSSELLEKFYLPSMILERKNFQSFLDEGNGNPFDQDGRIVIVSYQFAAKHADELHLIPWNLAVIDEAHRIRNSWQKKNQTGRILKGATAHVKKILLTATPLQNNAMELFGLLSFIDSHVFGSEESFRAQYLRLVDQGRFQELRERIAPFIHRTLRRQVVQYVPYTKRMALTETFTPANDEQSLYDDFTTWLARPTLHSLPTGQRHLIVLVLHKLLASSTFALESALGKMIARLQTKRALMVDDVADDLDGLEDQQDDWDEDPTDPEALVSLDEELDVLKEFQQRARTIGQNAKGNKLLMALDQGFQKMRELGAADKAIIFTESRRTQQYLLEILADSPYQSSVVLFNGDNNSAEAKMIYRKWVERHAGSDKITGSTSSDTRAALVEHFRDSARIMIATEAAAEGVNLQFCSLLMNYDLPWNPQRIEQRIGRCHRYGQKYDVVVVNFLNTRNQADVRVFQLLNDKLRLFEGVFGASDEVLGVLGSGVDFERRILGIYQTCRTRKEIDDAFGQLQLDLDGVISEEMSKTKKLVLENLDEEVHQRLKILEDEANIVRSSQERALYYLTKHLLRAGGSWNDIATSFQYQDEQYAIQTVTEPHAHLYRLQSPLAQEVVDRAKALQLSATELTFYYSERFTIGALEDWIGQSGWMQVEVVTRESTQEAEDLLIVAAMTDDGTVLDSEVGQKLFQLPAETQQLTITLPKELETVTVLQRKRALDEARERQQEHFSTEIDKLDLWAEDLKDGLELRIKELAKEITETRRASTLAIALEDKLNFQRQLKELERERNEARTRLYDAQDEIDKRRDDIIAEIENQLKVAETVRPLLIIRWNLR